MKPIAPPLLVIALCLAALPGGAQAQVAGFAELDGPQTGDEIRDLVTIEGTADHPAFESYELNFAHDPNPTGTWFPIGERQRTPVQEGRLALWDTNDLSPGTYQLRLTVYTQEGAELTARVRDLQLGVHPPSLVEAAEGSQDPAAAPERAAEPEVGEVAQSAEPARPPSANETLLRLLGMGAASALLGLTLFGLYRVIRPRVRGYLARLQVRQRRRERRRRGRR